MLLTTVCPSLKPATDAELSQLAAQGFYDPEFATEQSLDLDAIRFRAGFYLLPEDEGLDDAAFDAWIDYAESMGWDPETIDMSLSFC